MLLPLMVKAVWASPSDRAWANWNGTTTRGMIVTILWRMEGEPVVNYLMPFTDVPASWYTEARRTPWTEAPSRGFRVVNWRCSAGSA